MKTKELIIPDKIVKEIDTIKVVVKDFKVSNKDEQSEAGKYAVAINRISKLLKEKLENATKEHKQAVKQATDAVKPYLNALGEAEVHLRGIIAKYQLEAQKQADLERQEALKNIDPFDVSDETANKLAAIEPDKKVSGVGFSKVAEIIITDESLLPDKYWVVDRIALRKDIMAGVKVPGAEKTYKLITRI